MQILLDFPYQNWRLCTLWTRCYFFISSRQIDTPSLPLIHTHKHTHTLVHTQPDRTASCGMILINNNYELTQSENLIACWLRICQIPQPWGGRVQRARGLAVANDFIRCLQTVAYGCGIAYTRSCAARILSHGKAIRRRVRALGCNIWLASTWLH